MITFTKEEQALLDRGWPRMIRLVDGHAHDRNPERAALAWGSNWRDDVYHSEWPRDVAARVVRLGPRIVEPEEANPQASGRRAEGDA